MSRLVVRASGIAECGAYREAGVIVFGVRVAAGAPFESVIFQIDEADSDQRRDQWGMYAEVDGNGHYGAVSQFDFDPRNRLLDITLQPKIIINTAAMSFQLPDDCASDVMVLVARMATLFRDYPPLL
jgi:hypothetical protein